MHAKKTVLTVAVCGLLAWGLRAAAVSGVSGTVGVDTRFQANSLTAADQACDTRSVAVAGSPAVSVDTRTPLGTMILLK